MTDVTAWSFSRYDAYRKCPAFFNYKNNLRLPDPPSPAMERGNAIHKLGENFVKGAISKLPLELKLFESEFKALKKQKIKIVEEQWAFKQDWTPTGWFDKDCWVRMKLDVGYLNPKYNVFVPIDHKTGKCRSEEHEKYSEQLELFSLGSLVKYPTVAAVAPRLWYLDHGIVWAGPDDTEVEYTHADLPKLKKSWEIKVAPMFKDKVFKPTPSDAACRFCPYSKARGGPCRY